MAIWVSNGHVTDDVTWLQRCCEAAQSAILATAWLLDLQPWHNIWSNKNRVAFGYIFCNDWNCCRFSDVLLNNIFQSHHVRASVISHCWLESSNIIISIHCVTACLTTALHTFVILWGGETGMQNLEYTLEGFGKRRSKSQGWKMQNENVLCGNKTEWLNKDISANRVVFEVLYFPAIEIYWSISYWSWIFRARFYGSQESPTSFSQCLESTAVLRRCRLSTS